MFILFIFCSEDQTETADIAKYITKFWIILGNAMKKDKTINVEFHQESFLKEEIGND